MLARSWAFDGLIAGFVAALSALSLVQPGLPRPAAVLGLVMAVALLWRRIRPLAVMGVIATTALAQVIFFAPEYGPLPYDIAILIAMYSVVKYAPRLRDAYFAAAVVAAGILIQVITHWTPDNWWLLASTYLGAGGTVWLTGYVIRNRRAYLKGLEERAATLEREREHLAHIAVAEERAAIARELHDVVAHGLAVMVVQADGARYALDTDPGKVRQALAVIGDTGREALGDMKKLVGVLRGERTLPQLPDLVARARGSGLSVEADLGDLGDLPQGVRLAVTRIVQEALTNVMRHAGKGVHVTLSVRRGAGGVCVKVLDDGRRAAGTPGEGNGLLGMRERVAVHGGFLRAGPHRGGGWAVEAEIPA